MSTLKVLNKLVFFLFNSPVKFRSIVLISKEVSNLEEKFRLRIYDYEFRYVLHLLLKYLCLFRV